MDKKTALDSEAWLRMVIAGANALDVAVTPLQAQAMGLHARELIQWNRVSNLTAITDPAEVAIKHYVDSLAPMALIPKGARVLDVGSGGGFPGLPIKIVRMDIDVTLVDSVRKKTSFLNYAIGKLNMKGIHAIHARIEDLAINPAFRGRFDIVISRAFAALENFAAMSVPFLAPGGSLLAMKGPQAEHDHETGAMDDAQTVVFNGNRFKLEIRRYTLPTLGDQRRLVRLMPF